MSRGRLVRRAPFESNSLRRAVNWHLSSGWPIRFSSAAHRAGAAGAAGIVATSKLWFPIIARADDNDEALVAPRPIYGLQLLTSDARRRDGLAAPAASAPRSWVQDLLGPEHAPCGSPRPTLCLLLQHPLRRWRGYRRHATRHLGRPPTRPAHARRSWCPASGRPILPRLRRRRDHRDRER